MRILHYAAQAFAIMAFLVFIALMGITLWQVKNPFVMGMLAGCMLITVVFLFWWFKPKRTARGMY